MSSSTSSPSASATGSGFPPLPSIFKLVGILLAITSGLLIGSSFVFKKKGLLRSQAGHELGEGVAYLKSPMWWFGMTLMILGEICNFAAYAFVEAIVVTPLGALSVVISAILSSIFLKETLTFFGWVGCGLCIVGSVIIALNAPQEPTVGDIRQFQKLFFSVGFLALGAGLISASLTIIIFVLPKYGKKSMLWCILICSMIGGLSVSTTTGLGSAIVMSIFQHRNQFNYWFPFFLIGFVVVTLLTEVYYLNMALARFNTAMVTPTYYVIFTFFTLVTTVVLFQGLKASAPQILTLVMGFLVICAGITILQMSKVDPTHLNKLDRRSTILLQAARRNTESGEKSIVGIEDPGVDALRGTFGTVGSIIRARSARRMSQHARSENSRLRHGFTNTSSGLPIATNGTVERHQLYDAPVPKAGTLGGLDVESTRSPAPPRTPTIKFGDQDVAHYYRGTGVPADARHETLASHISSPRSGQGSNIPRHPTPQSFNDLDRGPLTAPPAGDRFFHSPESSGGTPATAIGSGFIDVKYDDEPPQGTHRFAGHSRKRSGSRTRKYPKGGDDTEESISLVEGTNDRDSPLSLVGDSESEPEGIHGIRLLQSSATRI